MIAVMATAFAVVNLLAVVLVLEVLVAVAMADKVTYAYIQRLELTNKYMH